MTLAHPLLFAAPAVDPPSSPRTIIPRRHYAPVAQTEMFTANPFLEYLELPILPGVELSQEDTAALVDRPEKQVAAIEHAFRAELARIAERFGAQPTQADLDSVFREWGRRRLAKLDAEVNERATREQRADERAEEERLRRDVAGYLREHDRLREDVRGFLKNGSEKR